MSGGSSRRIAVIVSGAVAREKARRPDAISYSTHPSAKMSARGSAVCPLTCSGAMYPTVPNTVPGSVAPANVCPSEVSSARRRDFLPREAEVEDFHVAIVSDEHVLRLDVPVDDAPFVGGGETVGDGGADLHDLSRRQRAPTDERAKRLAAEELGHRVDDAVLLAEIMDGEDVRVRECGDGAGLALEAGARRFVRGEPGRQELDGHLAIEREVARAVHLAHAPGAERCDDLYWPSRAPGVTNASDPSRARRPRAAP